MLRIFLPRRQTAKRITRLVSAKGLRKTGLAAKVPPAAEGAPVAKAPEESNGPISPSGLADTVAAAKASAAHALHSAEMRQQPAREPIQPSPASATVAKKERRAETLKDAPRNVVTENTEKFDKAGKDEKAAKVEKAEKVERVEKVGEHAAQVVMMKKKKNLKLKKGIHTKPINVEDPTEASVKIKSDERHEKAPVERESFSVKEEAPRKEAPRPKETRMREAEVKETTHTNKEPSPPLVRKTASAPAAQVNIASMQKTPMIKAFRIEDVLSACTANDGVFARRLPQGGCQFFAWPGTPLAVASHAVSTMPDTIRTVHALFGREKTPVDLVLDIDCPVPQEHWSMARVQPFQKKVLDDVLSVVTAEIEAVGESIETQVVLQSPNLKKASFHVHTKLKDVAFEDYNSLHGFLYRFHAKIPHADMQIYRPNGMLRMHRCMKENHTSSITVFEDARWNIGFPGGVVPDPIAALHSACIREEGTYSRLLHFEAPRAHIPAIETLKGQSTDARSPLILLPRTEREAVETLSQWMREGLTEADVGEWRSWISLGINAYRVAYNFRDAQTLKRPAMEELLDAWVVASKKCALKYRHGVCEAKWATFDINKLSKSNERDWWLSYQRVGRIAMANAAAANIDKSKKP